MACQFSRPDRSRSLLGRDSLVADACVERVSLVLARAPFQLERVRAAL